MPKPEPGPPEQRGDDAFDRSKTEQRVYFILRYLTALTLPFRRRNGGDQSMGTPTLLALISLFVWANAGHSLLCLWYAEAYVVALILYRLTRDRLAYGYYEGKPFLMAIFRNEEFASAMESLLLLTVGYLLYIRFPAFGLIFMASGAGCAVNEIIAWHQQKQMLIEYRNGQRVMEYQRSLYKRAGK